MGASGRALPSPFRAKELVATARLYNRNGLDEYASKQLLAEFGIATPEGRFLSDESEAEVSLAGLVAPWAVKIISPEIHHKSDGGYVALSIREKSEAVRVMVDMHTRASAAGSVVDGFLVERMAAPGIEVIVGGYNDKCFGPVIMFGLGGIFVEVLQDVSFRICPIDRLDALDMISELKGSKIFEGVRGGIRANRDTLVDLLLKIGGTNGLMVSLSEDLEEIDLNPVIVNERRAVAVDAVISLRQLDNGGS